MPAVDRLVRIGIRLGRDVKIVRGQSQPRAYRFMVGDSSEIGIL